MSLEDADERKLIADADEEWLAIPNAARSPDPQDIGLYVVAEAIYALARQVRASRLDRRERRPLCDCIPWEDCPHTGSTPLTSTPNPEKR